MRKGMRLSNLRLMGFSLKFELIGLKFVLFSLESLADLAFEKLTLYSYLSSYVKLRQKRG